MSESAKCMRLTMVVRKGFSEKVTAELTKNVGRKISTELTWQRALTKQSGALLSREDEEEREKQWVINCATDWRGGWKYNGRKERRKGGRVWMGGWWMDGWMDSGWWMMEGGMDGLWMDAWVNGWIVQFNRNKNKMIEVIPKWIKINCLEMCNLHAL